MYGWLWQRLPGPFALRFLIVVLVIIGLVLLLFTVIYPALYPYLPFSHVTVDQGGTSG